MTTTCSTDVEQGLPAPRAALLELGLTDEQIDDAAARCPLVLAFQADKHPGAYFDVERAAKALRAIGMFKLTKGRRWAGLRMRLGLGLAPWQAVWIIAPLFGWVYHDEATDQIVRVIRTAWIELPRKNGKSTISSAIALVLLLADGEPGAEVYAAAGSTLQAGRVVEAAKQMCLTAKAARDRVELLSDIIRVPRTGSVFRALSRIAEAAHGLDVSGAVIDEVHTLRLRRGLVEAIETGTGSRSQPLIVFITTADEHEIGTIYDEKHEYTRKCANRIISDPAHYGVIFADETGDPFAEETWRRANPGLGISPTVAYMAREAEKARNTPTYFPTFARLHLGRRLRATSPWLDLARWDAAAGMVDLTKLKGRRAWGGLDLSAVSDFTAWWMGVESKQPGVELEFFWRFWIPEDVVEDLERRLQVPLARWIREGWVTPTEGNVIDYAAVERSVIADCRFVDMQRVSYDRMFAGQMVQNLEIALKGCEVEPVAQTFLGLSPACKELERMLGNTDPNAPAGVIRTGGNPVARWMADCVEIRADGNDNLRPEKPDRQKASTRIDGIQAAVTGLDGYLRRPRRRSYGAASA